MKVPLLKGEGNRDKAERSNGNDFVLNLLFHPIAFTGDGDNFGVMEEPIEHGGSEGGIVVEDAGPLFEGLVGRENNGTMFIALADDLEEQVGTGLIDRQVTEFINDQEAWREELFEFRFKAVSGLSGGVCVDDVNGCGKEHGLALEAGSMGQGDGEVGFTQTDPAEKNNVGVILYKVEAEKVLHGGSIEFGRPAPIELCKSLNDRETSGAQAPFDFVVSTLVGFPFDEVVQEEQVRPLLLSGLLEQGAVVLADEGQFEFLELFE